MGIIYKIFYIIFMNITKLFAFITASAILLACGSQDESGTKEIEVINIDSEPNGTVEEANPIIPDGTKFAGTLDGSEEDIFTFPVRIGKGDEVAITINAEEALMIDFYRLGIDKKETMETKSGTLKATIESDYSLDGESTGEEIPFYIRLYPVKYDPPPNKYRISVVIKKK